MKRKGFTLIELLAVIVILAIIALIATPIVMNTIEKSKKGAAERSTENYLKQVETAVVESLVDGSTLGDDVYTVDNATGKITNGYQSYDINTNGTKPTEGTIIIKNGEVVDGSYLKMDNNIVNFVDGKGEIKNNYEVIVGDIANQTSTIKYDPVAQTKNCTLGSTNCYEWYVLEDKGTDYAGVSLIMNQNLSQGIYWITEEDWQKAGGVVTAELSASPSCSVGHICYDTTKGPITSNNYLKSATSNWNNLAFLPTGEQIAKIIGKDSIEYISQLPTWLYDNLGGEFSWAYLTSSKITNLPEAIWIVTTYGQLNQNSFTMTYGIRPVITLLKSQLQ